MSELTIEQLIKIILGVLVFVAVVIALFLFFKNQVIEFFRGFGGNSSGIFWVLTR
ncbi:MAG: hypothetical protein PHH00_03710 [Candidatus Nanoarchaeia archaeon]|nr:hypothetical protein [Candidatus Nanoarchaeia archaeon]